MLSVLRQGRRLCTASAFAPRSVRSFGVFYAAPVADIFSTLLAIFLLYRAIKKDLVSAKPHSPAKVEKSL